MAHGWFENALREWGDELTAEEFLTRFAPIHVWWHEEHGEWDGEPILGFLSFHHDVIKELKRSFDRSSWDFPGPWMSMQPALETYRTTNGDRLDQLSDPQEFSREIENWHNFVHRNPAYPDIMNPLTNIWTWRFWALHERIDGEFIALLGREGIDYDDVAHETV